MAKIRKWVLEHDGKILKEQWHYMCPGCGYIHAVGIGKRADGSDYHSFNGDVNKPTFRPSLLQDFVPGKRCHSYITDGFIKFESDCDHMLRSTTVELPDIADDDPRLEVQ